MWKLLLVQTRTDCKVVLLEADGGHEVVLCEVDIVLLKAAADSPLDVLL